MTSKLKTLARGFFALALLLLAFMSALTAQTRTYPDKIRGYKVERTVVEVKKPGANHTSKAKPQSTDEQSDSATAGDNDVDQLIQFGQPELAHATPLGITFAM